MAKRPFVIGLQWMRMNFERKKSAKADENMAPCMLGDVLEMIRKHFLYIKIIC